jgi:hypothetical protein
MDVEPAARPSADATAPADDSVVPVAAIAALSFAAFDDGV